GYRTVSVPDEAHAGKRDAPVRFEIDDGGAAIVRRIFRAYAAGRSRKAIAHQLNADAVPFPAKDTKRGPARRGWAISTIYTILCTEKNAGAWVGNRPGRPPRGGARPTYSRYLPTGLLRCAICGARM